MLSHINTANFQTVSTNILFIQLILLQTFVLHYILYILCATFHMLHVMVVHTRLVIYTLLCAGLHSTNSYRHSLCVRLHNTV